MRIIRIVRPSGFRCEASSPSSKVTDSTTVIVAAPSVTALARKVSSNVSLMYAATSSTVLVTAPSASVARERVSVPSS
ncbi:hypothetical protein BJF82_15290 [Kytococcus sp. CUA-901]|nr:hypothetical protein BJF82_15290 [Kytococcus sp. CUA-901]